MPTIRRVTIAQLADLLQAEVDRGVICGKTLLQLFESGLMPRKILDLMNNVRFAVERTTDGGFEVTEFPSSLAPE